MQDAAAELIALNGFEQRGKISFAKSLVTFTLDNLKEERTNHRIGENLQQQPLPCTRRAVKQDTQVTQSGKVFAVLRYPVRQHVVIGVGGIHEFETVGP